MTKSDGTLRYLRPSNDRRTNVWQLTPGCGHKPFSPGSTMFDEQVVSCPACGAQYHLRFSDQSVKRDPA